MAQKLTNDGYQIVEYSQKADICIINTCTVTNMSDRKSRQMIRKAKEKNPNSKIIAVGCYVEVAKQELEKMPNIDLVLGNEEKVDIAKYCDLIIKENNSIQKEEFLNNEQIINTKEFSEFGSITYTEKTRAVVKIQDGCDRFCTYCIIPYARGRIRSRVPQNVIKEIKRNCTERNKRSSNNRNSYSIIRKRF